MAEIFKQSLVCGLMAIIVLQKAAKIQNGETILIESAAGGLGLFVVQIYTIYAATIIAAASTDIGILTITAFLSIYIEFFRHLLRETISLYHPAICDRIMIGQSEGRSMRFTRLNHNAQ